MGFRAIAVCAALCGLTGPVVAEDNRAEHVVAALNLGAVGVRYGQAAPLVVAREMLAALAPSGAGLMGLEQDIEAEARFLIRGDARLAARLDFLEQRTKDPTLWVELVVPRYTLPEGQAATSIAVPDSVQLIAVTVDGEDACRSAGLARVWPCDPALARGTLRIKSRSGLGLGLMVLTTAPLGE